MKLVFSTPKYTEAEEAKTLLESKGIPAFVSNEHQRYVGRKLPGLHGVWVYIDRHHKEAPLALDDPGYEVSYPVDVDEFYRSLPHSGAAMRGKIIRWMIISLVVLLLMAVVLIRFISR